MDYAVDSFRMDAWIEAFPGCKEGPLPRDIRGFDLRVLMNRVMQPFEETT